VNKLNEETHETHDQETDSGRAGDGGELLAVGLGALFYEVDRLLHELL